MADTLGSWLAALGSWSARHPLVVIAITIVAMILSTLSVMRTHISGSLQDVLGTQSPAAAALSRITSEYRSLDELLIVATLPQNQPADDLAQQRLTAFAQRLDSAIAQSPSAVSMCRHVRYRADSDLRDYVQMVIVPAGAYYLDDAGFEALLQHVSPQQMRQEIAQAEALMSAPGPAASTLSKVFARDPLRLRELAEGRIAFSGGSFGPPNKSAADVSGDGRSLLIRVGGSRPANDLNFAQQFTDQITSISMQVNTDQLQIQIGGSYAIAAFASRTIRADDISSTIVTIVLIQLFFVVYYGRAGAPLLIGGTAGVGIFAGFGVHALLAHSITPLTAVAGATLAGLGVDYGIHYLSHYQDFRSRGMSNHEASVLTIRGTGPALASACLTTLLGFAALWPTRVAMLHDFAVLGSLGLIGALGTVFTLMPALLAITDRKPRRSTPRLHGRAVARLVESRPRLWTAASLLMIVASISAVAIAGGLPALETDPTVMHPRPNPALAATELARTRFATTGEMIPIEVRGDSPEQLVAAAHDVAGALVRSEAAGVVEVIGLNSLLPDPRMIAHRRERLRQLKPDETIAAFDEALHQSMFEPSAFEEYRGFLRTLLTGSTTPTLDTVLDYPAIAEKILPRSAMDDHLPPQRTIVLAHLAQPLRDRAARDAAIENLNHALVENPQATITGTDAVAYELEHTLAQDLPRTVAMSLVLVIIWLCIIFRSPVDIALSFIPVAFGTICLIGFIEAFGLRVNAVNGVALPLLAGIAVDSGVFFVLAVRHASVHAGGFGVMCSSVIGTTVTNMLGFATLYWTRTPAVRSLGVVSAIGILAGLWGTLFLLLPLLVLRNRRAAAGIQTRNGGQP